MPLQQTVHVAAAVLILESFLYCSGLQTVGIFRVGSSKKRVRQVGVSHLFDRHSPIVQLLVCYIEASVRDI